MIPQYENASDLSDKVNKMLADSGKPFILAGPAVSLVADNGKMVGVAADRSLPTYAVENALKHGAEDFRVSALDFSRKARGDLRITENIRHGALALAELKSREEAGLTESSNVVPLSRGNSV